MRRPRLLRARFAMRGRSLGASVARGPPAAGRAVEPRGHAPLDASVGVVGADPLAGHLEAQLPVQPVRRVEALVRPEDRARALRLPRPREEALGERAADALAAR